MDKNYNMKFITAFLLIILLSFVSCLYFPWWTIAFIAFVVLAFIPLKPVYAFLCGFASIFLFWTLLSFYISSNNEHVLAHKVSLLVLKTDSPFMLIFATGLIGGLVAGFAALTASFIRRIKAAETEVAVD
jgi:hypothetical protein